MSTYHVGPASGLDTRLFAPDGEPWCLFRKGFACVNGERCINHNAVRQIAATLMRWPS